jgi:6-phosphogluconolactonase
VSDHDSLHRRYFHSMLSRRGFLVGATAFAVAPSVAKARPEPRSDSQTNRLFAYVGTSTGAIGNGGNGEGISLFEVKPRTGELLLIKLAAHTPSPSWLSLDPSGQYLYAVNEVSDFEGGVGSVSAFAVNRSDGGLRFLNAVSSQGAGPAYLSVDSSGKYVFVANYLGASVAVLPVLPTGALASASDIRNDIGSVGHAQPTNAPPGSFALSGHDAPHAHMIQADPGNRFVLQTDLGQDRIYVYNFDGSDGKLTPIAGVPFVSLPAGDGPRHFSFHPNGRWLYSIQEEASTLVFFRFDPTTGSLSPQQTVSTLPTGFKGSNFTSEVMVSPDGRFLYAANRLHDTIAVFSISADGNLRRVSETSTQGDYPRHFQIDPSGSFLYACNQRSDNVTSFRINRSTGMLTFTGQYTSIGSPACIAFLVLT